MTLVGGMMGKESEYRRVVRELVESVRRFFRAVGCRVCRVYWLGWRTVGFRLPGRRIIVVHFYTRGWYLTPARVAAVVEAAEMLRENVDPRARRRVIIVAGGGGRVTLQARRLARALSSIVVNTAGQLKAAVAAVAADIEMMVSGAWGFVRRLVVEVSSYAAITAARLGVPVFMNAPTGPPPRKPVVVG